MSFPREVDHLQIPLPHILLATNNFDEKNFIATGGFGSVYQGQSEQYGTIAVKRLDHNISGQGQHEFMMEIALLSTYKHENLVSLVGFCDQDNEKILVYKHESNGSLDKLLKNKDLNWIQRLRICLDAAKGLKYLHDDVGSHHRVLHRDVKSSNILLDENWKAKISDFGLCKISPANVKYTFLISNACGTIGYLDPEYLTTGVLTQKSDVYSFGVVLFEVLCGRLARVVEYEDEPQLLFILVKKHYERDTLDEIIDFHLKQQMNSASLDTFSTIAYQCLKKRREDRPTMSQIVEQLEISLDHQLVASSGLGNDANIVDDLSQEPTSYGGMDIRKTFVDHLHTALLAKGIYAYMGDETLHQGESIGLSLFEAIRKSQIVLIIFSKNYAKSSLCLDELAYAMKSKYERAQIIMPIFYDVDSWDVRNQQGEFGKAFSTHELNIDKVESWRKALMDVTNFSGWAPNDNNNG